MGLAANEPEPPRPAAAIPLSLNAHTGSSLDTFTDEMAESGASRVFARSAFEYGQEPGALVVEATAFVVTVLQVGAAAVSLCPPHAAISMQHAPTPTTRAALVLEFALI
jgi:hypothetical protein